jgi:hypothetical protein
VVYGAVCGLFADFVPDAARGLRHFLPEGRGAGWHLCGDHLSGCHTLCLTSVAGSWADFCLARPRGVAALPSLSAGRDKIAHVFGASLQISALRHRVLGAFRDDLSFDGVLSTAVLDVYLIKYI